MNADPVVDVRAIAPAKRAVRVAQAFEALAGGECLRVVDERELGPYFDRLVADYPGIFDWTYEERGPRLWRARIDRLVP